MKNKHLMMGLVISLIILFIFSAVNPIVFGYNIEIFKGELKVVDDDFARHFYPEFYDCYNDDEIPDFEKQPNYYLSIDDRVSGSEEKINPITLPLSGPMDSPWPMYCHDVRHTGRSPYNTVDTWEEIWKFKQEANDYVRGSPVVGDDGTIYFGGSGDFYALYPNGTLKWKYDGLEYYVWSAPAIDENGTIYVGDCHGLFYAINPNGTIKWTHKFSHDVRSSPAIGNDGTIYFGDSDYYINALYPNNGSVKWRYKTGLVVYSSPAIGQDGTVYCGSHDEHLYAFYPNNGTLKWKYKTGHWVRVSPCIADDGTIYVVSLDNYLHALYPNGTMKWKTNVGAGTSPTIGQDGTIYCGYTELYAINPSNGSVKWTFDNSDKIKGSTPCHSFEDTIYFGAGTYLFAVYPDGTLKWKERICNDFIDSAPAIGEDGTLYVGSGSTGGGKNFGHLHAFGIGKLEANANGPYNGLINEPVQFKGSASGGYSPHLYHWDFGDTHTSDEQNPLYTYTSPGNYTVTLTVTDDIGNTSSDTTWAWIQDGNSPPTQPDIDGPTSGYVGISYPYEFVSTDPEGTCIWYYIDWGDETNTGWIGPYNYGVTITKSHTWSKQGTYTIKCKAKDPYDDEGPWGELEITMPRRNRATYYFLLLRFLEQFPLLERLLYFIG